SGLLLPGILMGTSLRRGERPVGSSAFSLFHVNHYYRQTSQETTLSNFLPEPGMPNSERCSDS
ncbi:MAG: hypothetical protein P8182_20550, partial [Deltaproteobacteria bacterium]